MDTWRSISSDEIKRWRDEARRKVAQNPGHRWEYNTAHRQGLEYQAPDQPGGDQVTMERPRPERIREARDTVEVATREMISWVTEDRAQFMHRVRMLKQMGNFQHLTDEQAAEQLWNLCYELSQADAKRVYAEHYAKQALYAPRLVSV